MIGEKLNHYSIEGRLGAGGMGEVYLARDTRLDRFVALKFLPESLQRDTSARAALLREARSASRLNHPNVVTIYAVETAGDHEFIAMEYVDGQTLDEWGRSAQGDTAKVIPMLHGIAEALRVAHQAGIVHRDLKPGNVMVAGDGTAKVLDFGIALLTEAERAETTQATFGTTQYTSPEQASGGHVDHRTDLWSLGIIAYELLAGTPPFTGSYPEAVIYSIMHDPAPSLESVRPDCPKGLAELVSRLLSKDPAHRPADAETVIATIDSLLEMTSASVSDDDSGPSVAVLPFDDLSPEHDQDYFCDGVAEEIINVLAQLPGLRVAARTSCFAFKGKKDDIRDIGTKLNVSTVLEGSVRKAGKRIRITAQLINVEDGYHIWSERYDRDLEDGFAVQDDIAAAVSERLRGELLGETAITCESRQTCDISAYEAYLRGRQLWTSRTPSDLKLAAEEFDRALSLDPNYALAHVGLADSHIMLVQAWTEFPQVALPKIRAGLARALALDPNLAEAHASQGLVHAMFEWDFPNAEAAFLRALELNPNYATAHHWYSLYLTITDRLDDALKQADRARALDPLAPAIRMAHWFALMSKSRDDQVIEECNALLEKEPKQQTAHLALSMVYEKRRDYVRALKHILHVQRVLETASDEDLELMAQAAQTGGWIGYHTAALEWLQRRAKTQPVPATYLAEALVRLGRNDEALHYLEQAAEQGDMGLAIALKDSPALDPVRDTERFKAICSRVFASVKR